MNGIVCMILLIFEVDDNKGVGICKPSKGSMVVALSLSQMLVMETRQDASDAAPAREATRDNGDGGDEGCKIGRVRGGVR